MTGVPSSFHNFFKSKYNLGFKVVVSKTIQKRIICIDWRFGYQRWHRPFKMAKNVYEMEIGVAVLGS